MGADIVRIEPTPATDRRAGWQRGEVEAKGQIVAVLLAFFVSLYFLIFFLVAFPPGRSAPCRAGAAVA